MRPSRSRRGLSDGRAAPPPPPAGANAPVAPKSGRRWLKYAVLGALVATAAAYPLVQFLRVRHHTAAAERALDRRDFREAKDRLEKCLAIRSDDPATHLLLLRTARRAGNDDEAAAQLAALKKFPADPAVEREARLLDAQRGNRAAVEAALADSLARPDAADPLALEAGIVGGLKVLLPLFAEHETVAGTGLPLLTKVQRGVDLWLRVRPGRADQTEGLVWRGLTRAYANEVPAACADFRAALALDPAHRDARFHLALSVVQEAPQEAAGHLRALHEQHPGDAQVMYTLASVSRNAGRYDEARRLLDEVLALNPGDRATVATLVERGLLALDQGQPDAAERALTRALALAPDDLPALFALAACLRAADRPAEAQAVHARTVRVQDERRKRADAPAPPR